MDKMFDHPLDPPPLVMLAVGLLSLFFLGGAIYLFISNPFTGTQVIAPAHLPEAVAVLADYDGSLLGLERARAEVDRVLSAHGLSGGQPLTVFPISPLFMRPAKISGRVGYLLPLGRRVEGLPASVRLEVLRPGKRLIVRVRGRGNFTGNKAYKAAVKSLRPIGLRPDPAERFEVKKRIDGREYVEHWIPVRP